MKERMYIVCFNNPQFVLFYKDKVNFQKMSQVKLVNLQKVFFLGAFLSGIVNGQSSIDEDLWGKEPDPTTSIYINQENCGKIRSKYIVGKDSNVDPNAWPWVCSLGTPLLAPRHWDHQCGAVLITLKHLLTAAHCPEEFKQNGLLEKTLFVKCGDHDLSYKADDAPNAHTQTRHVRNKHMIN